MKTVEFFPQAGKYHLNGHRKFGISQTPEQTEILGTVCPKCGKSITLGVSHKVKELKSAVQTIRAYQRPYIKLIPLMELLALTMSKR